MPTLRPSPACPAAARSADQRAAAARSADHRAANPAFAAWIFGMAVAATALLAPGAPAQAQSAAPNFSAQPIKMVVGATPGGTTDMVARMVGQGMSKVLGTPVVIENRGGAGGNIAAEQVVKAAPDGHTLLTSFTSHGVNAALYPDLPFDTMRDFTAISIVAQSPSVLIARPDLPIKDVAELIAYAKKNPGKLNFALGGVGSSLHMATEQFKYMAGIDIVGVPYKGTSPAMADMLGGHMDLMFAAIGNALPHLKSGKVKLLAVTGAKRMPQFAQTPTIGETVKGFESVAWFGIFGPAKMPPATVAALNDAVLKSLQTPEVTKRFETDSMEKVGNSSAEATAFVAAEIEKWKQVVKATGAKPE